MAKDDIAYFRKRLSEEQALEAQSATAAVRNVHSERAEMYARRLAALDADGTVLVPMRSAS